MLGLDTAYPCENWPVYFQPFEIYGWCPPKLKWLTWPDHTFFTDGLNPQATINTYQIWSLYLYALRRYKRRYKISTWTYVSRTDIYPHMPIPRPHAARFHERRISSVTFTSVHLYDNVYMRVGVARAQAVSSDLGLLGEQSSQKWEIPYHGRWRSAEQNLTPWRRPRRRNP